MLCATRRYKKPTGDFQKIELVIDLSLIFNETGYINKTKCINKNDQYIYKINTNVTHVILIQSIDSPIKIGNNFLHNYKNLISVDTSKLVNVTAIGDYFCSECDNLQNFNTSGLTTLITIGNKFLYCCQNLINFDATKLISLIIIENSFMCSCHNLTVFDASKLISLTTIGDCFMCSCYNLMLFDASKLTKIITIGLGFFAWGQKLTIFNASGLTSLTTIGDNFLYECNENLTITIKNPPYCLTEQLIKTNYKIIQLYDRPIVHLDNNCVI